MLISVGQERGGYMGMRNNSLMNQFTFDVVEPVPLEIGKQDVHQFF
jgi:hypothetical protein